MSIDKVTNNQLKDIEDVTLNFEYPNMAFISLCKLILKSSFNVKYSEVSCREGSGKCNC